MISLNYLRIPLILLFFAILARFIGSCQKDDDSSNNVRIEPPTNLIAERDTVAGTIHLTWIDRATRPD